MRKPIQLLLSAVMMLSTMAVTAQTAVGGNARFKTSGRTLQESPSFRSGKGLQRIPSKAEVYGPWQLQGHSQVCPSAPALDASSAARAPRKATEGERTARALLIYNDTEKSTNRIIEMPITAGAVESFTVVAEKVPKMPYKAYGEKIETAVAYDDKFTTSTFCDMIYSQTNSVYTTADWKHQYDYDYRIADLVATAVAYNSSNGMCYGVFQGINPTTRADEGFSAAGSTRRPTPSPSR